MKSLRSLSLSKRLSSDTSVGAALRKSLTQRHGDTEEEEGDAEPLYEKIPPKRGAVLAVAEFIEATVVGHFGGCCA
jgi:hypothetical protein